MKDSMRTVHLEPLRSLNLSGAGLSAEEVQRQRHIYGWNLLGGKPQSRAWQIFLETSKDPMLWFLISLTIIFGVLGENREALTTLVAILPLALMDAYLHWRTEAASAVLKKRLRRPVCARRDGVAQNLLPSELVPGDLVELEPDNLVPADGIIESHQDLQIDESAITGESLPLRKQPILFSNLRRPIDLGLEFQIPEKSILLAGTRVISGRCRLRIFATGPNTSYGQVIQSSEALRVERTRLQKSVDKMVRLLVWGAALFCMVLFVVRLAQGKGLVDALVGALVLAVAAIPEEFPVAFAFFLGVGVFRLARLSAYVRRSVSVENIGRVSLICTDKTGTITEGELRLSHIEPGSLIDEKETLRIALCASSPDNLDPVDRAINLKAKEYDLVDTPRLKRFPFTEDRKRETNVIKSGDQSLVATKGAPEVILSICEIPDREMAIWLERTENLARSGHRVLACASQVTKPMDSQILALEPIHGFTFAGLLAFEDPLRIGIKEAFDEARGLGVKVVMITGDHRETAFAIGKEIGLEETCILARHSPKDKLEVVRRFQNQGEIVAVTGDGVNDVPALKAADVGIAMGQRGTQSAKEVAAIVLGDDNFKTIVAAIREGRQLYANLRRCFTYLLLIHIPLVVAAALIPLMGYPLLFLPSHIVWLELIIHPSAILGFQHSANKHTPAVREQIFSAQEIYRIVAVGALEALAIFWLFAGEMRDGMGEPLARAKSLAYLSLLSSLWLLLLNPKPPKTSVIISTLTLLGSIALLQSSMFADLLHVKPISWHDGSEVLLAAVMVVALFLLFRSRILKQVTNIYGQLHAD